MLVKKGTFKSLGSSLTICDLAMVLCIKVDIGGQLWLYLKRLLLGLGTLSSGLGISDEANTSGDGEHRCRGEVWKPHGKVGVCMGEVVGVGFRLSDQRKSVRTRAGVGNER